MKKLLLAATFALLALPFGSARGEATSCYVLGEGDAPAHECTLVANGPTDYYQATPNDWEIFVYRLNPVTQLLEKIVLAEGSTEIPGNGVAASRDREEVHVLIDRNCVPSTPACGNLGIIAAVSQ